MHSMYAAFFNATLPDGTRVGNGTSPMFIAVAGNDARIVTDRAAVYFSRDGIPAEVDLEHRLVGTFINNYGDGEDAEVIGVFVNPDTLGTNEYIYGVVCHVTGCELV